VLICRTTQVHPVSHSGAKPRYLYQSNAQMPKKRVKKKIFSAVKAVKANARARVGQPKPERVIAAIPREEKRGQKHPKTLAKLLTEEN
jgi:hypothetical protein